MTYGRVCELFVDVFERRAGEGGLFGLDRAALGYQVTTAGPPGRGMPHPDPDAALAPSARDIVALAPRADGAASIPIGAGEPVAYLFEAVSGELIVLGELTLEHQAAGAVERALAWVW